MVFRSTMVFLLMLLLGLVWSGCSRKESAQKTAPPSNGQVDLVALNQLLRKYVMWKKQIPMDMNDLVTSGFVSSLPPPPAGKTFVITVQPFGYEVKLMDQ